MSKLVATIIRAVLSIGITFFLSRDVIRVSNPLEFGAIWFLVYAMLITYCMARRIMIEENVTSEVSNTERRNSILDFLFSYIFIPLILIYMMFSGGPMLITWLITRIVPETWSDKIFAIVVFIELLLVVFYEVWHVIEEIREKRLLDKSE